MDELRALVVGNTRPRSISREPRQDKAQCTESERQREQSDVARLDQETAFLKSVWWSAALEVGRGCGDATNRSAASYTRDDTPSPAGDTHPYFALPLSFLKDRGRDKGNSLNGGHDPGRDLLHARLTRSFVWGATGEGMPWPLSRAAVSETWRKLTQLPAALLAHTNNLERSPLPSPATVATTTGHGRYATCT